MKLKKLHIQNYKSLVDLEIVEPNPFTVFAGPNGSGKSNIFEALEFASYFSTLEPVVVENIFGGRESIINFNSDSDGYCLEYQFENSVISLIKHFANISNRTASANNYQINNVKYPYTPLNSADSTISKAKENFNSIASNPYFLIKNNFRLFIKNETLNRIKYTSDKKLLPDASNLEAIIKNIITGEWQEEFSDWMGLFVPGFEKIEIHTDNIAGRDTLLIYEKGTKKPFTKSLISDGTYNILCLLAAVYHSDEPQFLCIEEPENGLNPYVVRSFVDFFRQQCEEKGHYIWLNTHSQTLVKALHPHELILVDKINGATTIKQFAKDRKLYGLEMDEAWLSNALGGGIPW